MKLYHSTTSPYVRKVLVLSHETGLAGKLELVTVATSPVRPDGPLSGANPLAKIPSLILSDGSVLYDSHVIADYLDGLHDGRRMIPVLGKERYRVLRTEALADGILDAGVLIRYETLLRPENKRWPEWIDGQSRKVLRSLDYLEREAASWADAVDLGAISTACALGWLEFRNVVGPIRERRPALFAWYERFRLRPSMQATEPKE